MKPPSRHATPRAALAVLALAVALSLLAGCSSPKGYYPAVAAQQRAAAEAAAVPPAPEGSPSTSTNTQATYQKLIEQMQQEGLWFASLAHIDVLEQRWTKSPSSIRLRADALRQTGQAAPSEAMYRQLMGTPLEAAGYHGLGLLAGAQADYPDAVRMLQQAQRHNPTDALLLSDLGYAQLRAGHIAEARIPLMQALQLKPDNPQVQMNLALYLQASRQPEQAEALMAAHHMTPATRAAIREAASNLALEAPSPPAPTATPATTLTATAVSLSTPEPSPPPQVSSAPLALKASGWPRRIHLLVRPETPALAKPGATTELPSPTPSPGGPP